MTASLVVAFAQLSTVAVLAGAGSAGLVVPCTTQSPSTASRLGLRAGS